MTKYRPNQISSGISAPREPMAYATAFGTTGLCLPETYLMSFGPATSNSSHPMGFNSYFDCGRRDAAVLQSARSL